MSGISNITKSKFKIAIIGLGYVGLPLLHLSSNHFNVVGYDKDTYRVNSLNNLYDQNKQIKIKDLKDLKNKKIISSNENIIRNCNIYIITVPTPIDSRNQPDLKLVKNALKTILKFLKDGDLIILESTVYPGATLELSKKIIEKNSHFKINKNYYLGYSPERINPGDNKNNLNNVTKVISASNKKSLKIVKSFYSKFIKKLYVAESIEIAESSKIIENIQRDVNIALINELTLLFKKMDLPMKKILDASKTKWNFLNFQPGLVGGHCIGIDPYYLAYQAKRIGAKSNLILAGRKINNLMINKVYLDISNCINKIKLTNKANILFLGLTFKENCPDFRNSKNIALFELLKKKYKNIFAHDPYVDQNLKIKYKNNLTYKLDNFKKYDFIILAVKHNQYKNLQKKFGQTSVYDMKYFYKNSTFYL